MVLLNSKPKSEYVLPPGLLCSTMGLTVVPSNVQKPRYSKATGENSTSQFNVRTGEDIPTILSPNTYSTWKPPVDLPFQNEGQNDLAEIPEMDEYPVTVPFTHPTPYADGLRTYRPVPDHR